jgi:hypothetical protein
MLTEVGANEALVDWLAGFVPWSLPLTSGFCDPQNTTAELRFRNAVISAEAMHSSLSVRRNVKALESLGDDVDGPFLPFNVAMDD